MKIIKPRVDFFGALPTDRERTLKFIEMAGRTCYKSEDRITFDSSEKFVRKLIKARHLAMVEHSNFVVKSSSSRHQGCANCVDTLAGKYLNVWNDASYIYVGGSLTAWYQRLKEVGNNSLFNLFIGEYGDLFNVEGAYTGLVWNNSSDDAIPKELHRYSARFICDRGVSHELVRHRPCSFAQESTRYVNYAGKGMEFIEPAGFEDWDYYFKRTFVGACTESEINYNSLTCGAEKSPQQARAVLSNALKTEVVVTADLAEWQHIFKLRCHKSAHPDMVRVMTMLRDDFINQGVIDE